MTPRRRISLPPGPYPRQTRPGHRRRTASAARPRLRRRRRPTRSSRIRRRVRSAARSHRARRSRSSIAELVLQPPLRVASRGSLRMTVRPGRNSARTRAALSLACSTSARSAGAPPSSARPPVPIPHLRGPIDACPPHCVTVPSGDGRCECAPAPSGRADRRRAPPSRGRPPWAPDRTRVEHTASNGPIRGVRCRAWIDAANAGRRGVGVVEHPGGEIAWLAEEIRAILSRSDVTGSTTVVAMRRFRGAWAQLRAGMNDAVAPSRLHGRRLRAEREAERIFEMSPALLAVAGFDGYLRRFNPAFEVFGYSREELLSRPWIEFAHPDDRERMLQAAASLERGADVVEVDNRVICRDGSLRWVEWSTRVVPEEGLFYAAGRDVTESRRAAEEQAALRRVATLVARETAPDAVFAAVAREVGEVLGVDATHLGRYDADGTVVSVAQWGSHPGVPIGARFPLEGDSVSARVLRTGRPARMDGYEDAPGVIAATIRQIGIRFSIGVPISVRGADVGRDDRHVEGAEPVSRRDRVAPPGLHGARGDRDLQRQRPRQGPRPGGRAGGAAPRRDARRAADAAGGGVRRRSPRRSAGCSAVDSIEMVRYEDDRDAVVVAGWGTLAPAVADRDARAARRPERRVARLPHRTRRAPRRLRANRTRADRRPPDGRRRALGRRHADRRRGAAVGRDGRGQRARRARCRRTPSRASASSPS